MTNIGGIFVDTTRPPLGKVMKITKTIIGYIRNSIQEENDNQWMLQESPSVDSSLQMVSKFTKLLDLESIQ